MMWTTEGVGAWGGAARGWEAIVTLLVILGTPCPGLAQGTPVPRNDDSHPALSPDGTQVVFESTRSGNSDLWRMDAEGSYPRRLTRDAGENQRPTWSPSGDRIAFVSDRSGTWQIWTMAPDGSEQTAITELEAGAAEPFYSPDGRAIVFVSPVDSVAQVMEVSLMNGSVEQLTHSEGTKSQPAVSWDGGTLAFVSDASGGAEIHVAGTDGILSERITQFSVDNPRRFVNGLGWTPRGDLIFGANRDGRGRYFFATDIYTLRPDGTELRRIVSGTASHNNPSMSRDGSRIAFDSFRYGGLDVFVVESDGSNLRNLTATTRNNFFATPTPDGEHVIFQSEREGQRDIYVMDRNGSHIRNLTDHPSDDRAPSLSADGSTLTFASFRDSEWGDIYTMDPDGGNLTKITPDGFFQSLDQFPVTTATTPDGGAIIFESAPVLVTGEAHWDIWRIDRDGANPVRLTSSPGTARSSAPAVSPDGATLLYHSNESGDFEIYRMPTRGGTATRLTSSPGLDYWPTWSPDGGHIYFTSRRDGHAELYRMKADGSDVERLTRGTPGTSHFLGTVDPSGRNLWTHGNRGGTTEIYRMAPDGSDEVGLTTPWGPVQEDRALSGACRGFTSLGQPHWSWTRDQIAFPGDCGGRRGIYVYDVPSDQIRRLEIELEGLDSPAWSTAGDRIAFNAESEQGSRDLYVHDLATGATERITTDAAHGGWVTWSPDDRWLNGYGPDQGGGRWNVFRVSVDGANRVRMNERQDVDHYNLTESPNGGEYLYAAVLRIWRLDHGGEPETVTPGRLAAFMPHWAPDGERFVFDGNEGSGWDLWEGKRSGRRPRRLTRRSERDSNATWSPDGGRIVYLCQIGEEGATLCIVDTETRRARPLFRPGD